MDLVDLLNARGIEYRRTNNPEEILISCTSGEHTDKSPSLSYNLEKNIFHCWSCGFSGGITKFMTSIGETIRLDVDSKQPYKIKKLKDKLGDLSVCSPLVQEIKISSGLLVRLYSIPRAFKRSTKSIKHPIFYVRVLHLLHNLHNHDLLLIR